MNGSADEADVLRFLSLGCFSFDDGTGYGCGSGIGSADGTGYGCGSVAGCGNVTGTGYGYGDGSGSGSDDGYGDGSGCGSGIGSGSGGGSCTCIDYGSGYGADAGHGYGRGAGFGHVYDVKNFLRGAVHIIDGVPTLISFVHGSYARGYILNADLTLKPTYIAKVGGFFAHGDTLRAARKDALAKYMECSPVEQRISEFIKAHPSRTRKYAGEDLYGWHGILTGSCRAGRAAWCNDKELDPNTAKLTVKQFCELTKDAYGGDVIRQLAKTMGIELKKEPK